MIMNALGFFYFEMGEFSRAEPLLTRSLEILKKVVGEEHAVTAIVLGHLGSVYVSLGDFTRAELALKRTLEIEENGFGADSVQVAITLDDLAVLYFLLGDYTHAEPLLQRSLAIKEKGLGSEASEVASTLEHLADLYVIFFGDFRRAEPLYKRSLAILEKASGPENPNVARVLSSLAFVYLEIGDYARAEQFSQRAMAISEKALGSKHPAMVRVILNLAVLDALQQRDESAFVNFNKVLAVQEKEISDVFTLATEEQKLKFIQAISGTYGAFLSLINQRLHTKKKAVEEGLEFVLRRKGIVLDIQSRALEGLRNQSSEGVRKEWGRLSTLRRDLARLLLNKPQKMSYDLYKTRIEALQNQIEEAEKRLFTQSASVASQLKQMTIAVNDISKLLPPMSALVEFVKIQDFDFVNKEPLPLPGRYLAFVLTSKGEVTLVDLGDASEIEKQVKRLRESISLSLKVMTTQSIQWNQDSLAVLYAKLWAPLEKSLKGVDKVFLSPDGLLNLVPFAALVDSGGRFLLERYLMAYLTSGRDLIGIKRKPIKPESELLLVANPAYNQKPTQPSSVASAKEATPPAATVAQNVSPYTSPQRSRDFRGLVFDSSDVENTKQEAREIPPLVPGKKKRVLVETAATEEAVKTARSPRILHLATHGFFLPDQPVPLEDKPALLVSEMRVPKGRYENPMVRSGLAFAGANHASEITEGEDGLLTALEVTGMDLHGTELVVLSACDTGVGDVQNGEGVFGLRRAFALAGAKNLMMSLWPVSDEITARQMKSFYKNLQKLPAAEALRQAQLETIRELKAKFGTAPPVLWAPFILQGARALGS